MFNCFCMFVIKHFINTGTYISKSKQCYNAKPSAYYFYMRMKMPLSFRTCISVPLKFHADTTAIFSQLNKTLNLQYHGVFCIRWRHVKVFTKCFHGKSVCPVIRWATGKKEPAKFPEAVILNEAFRGNFKRKLGSNPCYHTISLRTCCASAIV